jgi:hypothetical protein
MQWANVRGNETLRYSLLTPSAAQSLLSRQVLVEEENLAPRYGECEYDAAVSTRAPTSGWMRSPTPSTATDNEHQIAHICELGRTVAIAWR